MVRQRSAKPLRPGSNPGGASRKHSLRFLKEFFQLYSPSASYIELRSVIFASQVIFASRVLEANIISLLRKQKYHNAARHNITLCEAQNITNNLYFRRFYAIIYIRGDYMSWWTKQKILKVIMYVLLAFVFINCFLFEICPTLYPEWLRDGVGITGLFINAFWFIWCIVYIIKKDRNKKKK